MSWFGGGLSEKDKFVATLIAQADKTIEGVRFLEASIDAVDERAVAALRRLAEEASELRRVLIDELHKTFITPLDREDIFNLSHCYEDMVTYALTTLEEMAILKVDADDHIRYMVRLVREEAEELQAAILRLPHNPRVAGDHAREGAQGGARVQNGDQGAVRRGDRSGGAAGAVLPARSLPPHLQHVGPRGFRGERVRHGRHEARLRP